MAEYTLKTRADALKKMHNRLIKKLGDIAKGATMRAVEEATDLTPPTMNDLKGTNTRSGAMKQHWSTDSKIEPIGGALSGGQTFVTVLANNMQYASYVNDGHRVDRHFVPGLYVNSDGVLEYDADYGAGGGGLVVGTKTSYVEGLFMTEKAIEMYRKTVKFELDKLTREMSK